MPVETVSLKNMTNLLFSKQNCDFSNAFLEDDENPRLHGIFEKIQTIKSTNAHEVEEKTSVFLHQRNLIMVSRELKGTITLDVYSIKKNFIIFFDKVHHERFLKILENSAYATKR